PRANTLPRGFDRAIQSSKDRTRPRSADVPSALRTSTLSNHAHGLVQRCGPVERASSHEAAPAATCAHTVRTNTFHEAQITSYGSRAHAVRTRTGHVPEDERRGEPR